MTIPLLYSHCAVKFQINLELIFVQVKMVQVLKIIIIVSSFQVILVSYQN